MSEFFIEDETEQIDYPDGNWIEVKSELTQRDQDYITNAMMSYKGRELDVKIGRLALLERMVVKWSFDAPVNADNLSKLRRKYREPVLERINELNNDAYDYLGKNSEGASSDQPPSAS
jgi:hypothetical protein